MSDRDDTSNPRGGPGVDDVDPDMPPTEEEIAAASQLRDALDSPAAGSGDDPHAPLVEALRSAWSPTPLDEGIHAQMIDDMTTSEELALAADLRGALDGEPAGSATANLALALRAAWDPRPLDATTHREIVHRAVGQAPSNVVPLGRAKPSSEPRTHATKVTRRWRAIATATSVLGLAAGVLVWLTTTTASSPSEAPLARVRSTQPLFEEPFRAGETSARIDRIAIARAADYRDNRFAKWGVR